MKHADHFRFRWFKTGSKQKRTGPVAGNSLSARLPNLAAWWRFTKLAFIRTIGEVRRNRIGFSFPKTLSVNFQRRMEKEMKTKSKISGHIIRSGAWAVFLSVAFIAASSAFNSPNSWHNPQGRLAAMTQRRRLRVNPERSASPSASRFNERSKTFTGDTGFGQRRILIPSLRSMR